jgi:nitrite reductase/ring-hydroxylating ferredoxin subunit/uncharacterized membrane protein
MRSKASFAAHPIHPMLVALPIGLWIGSFVFDLIGTAKSAPLLIAAGFSSLVAGCVGAALAAIPGVIDLFGAVPPKSSARQRGLIHGGLNVIALIVFVIVAARRGGTFAVPDGLSLALSFVGLCTIGVSGWLGGSLVFNNQIGVDRRYANSTTLKIREIADFAHPACHQSELSDGQLMLIMIGDERVAIGRAAAGIFAFADLCTHRGGPLCDGALVGTTVQCPWHGSQFDVRTGRVIAGPAQEPIKAYGVELRNGAVYLVHPAVEDLRRAA